MTELGDEYFVLAPPTGLRSRARNWCLPALVAVNWVDCAVVPGISGAHVEVPGRSTWTSSTRPAGSGAVAHVTWIGVPTVPVDGVEIGTATDAV